MERKVLLLEKLGIYIENSANTEKIEKEKERFSITKLNSIKII